MWDTVNIENPASPEMPGVAKCTSLFTWYYLLGNSTERQQGGYRQSIGGIIPRQWSPYSCTLVNGIPSSIFGMFSEHTFLSHESRGTVTFRLEMLHCNFGKCTCGISDRRAYLYLHIVIRHTK